MDREQSEEQRMMLDYDDNNEIGRGVGGDGDDDPGRGGGGGGGQPLLEQLIEQYEQDIADTEMELDVQEQMVEFMNSNNAANEQRMAAIQKDTEKMENELQALDGKTAELVQSTNLQAEQFEQLMRKQQEIANGIREARSSLFAAQQRARNDLEELHSTGMEARKFFTNNSKLPNVGSVVLKLRNQQKSCCAEVQESVVRLLPMKTVAEDADQLEDLEEEVQELRLEVRRLGEKIVDANSETSAWHVRIYELREKLEAEQLRRCEISESYRTNMERVMELRQAVNDRQNDRKLLLEKVEAKRQTVAQKRENLKKKISEVEALQKEISAAKQNSIMLQNKLKLEKEEHERKIREIQEQGESDICAAKSVLLTALEKKGIKTREIEQARDELDKRSQLEAHAKVNREQERVLQDLRKEKAMLEKDYLEKKARYDNQLSELAALKCAHEENKTKAEKERSLLIEAVKHVSERILQEKGEKPRIKAQKDTAASEIHITTDTSNGSSIKEKKKSGKVVSGAGEDEQSMVQKMAGSAGAQEGAVQKPQPLKSDVPNTSSVVAKGLVNPFMRYSAAGGGSQVQKSEQQGLQLSSQSSNSSSGKKSKYGLSKRIMPNKKSSAATSKTRRQTNTRKKRQSKVKKPAAVHTAVAAALFEGDISVSTIKPMYASTPMHQKKDESASIRLSSAKSTPKKRGRPKGKNAKVTSDGDGRGSKSGTTRKDVFDLESGVE